MALLFGKERMCSFIWEINTSNRGSCDYFIVDQIEKICLRTLEKEKENDELEI